IKLLSGYDLCHHRTVIDVRCFHLRLGGQCGLLLLGRMEKDHRAILIADIRPLAIHLGGVVRFPEDLQQVVIAHALRVVFDFYHLGMAGGVRTHIAVRGIQLRAALKAHLRRHNSRYLPERCLYVPETARAKRRLFCCHNNISAPLLLRVCADAPGTVGDTPPSVTRMAGDCWGTRATTRDCPDTRAGANLCRGAIYRAQPRAAATYRRPAA